jgi:hypothetical protein
MSEWWGYFAQDVWAPLEREIEDRWRARFGGPEADALRATLWGVASRLDVELPGVWRCPRRERCRTSH